MISHWDIIYLYLQENSHFILSEMLLAAIEQMKFRNVISSTTSNSYPVDNSSTFSQTPDERDQLNHSYDDHLLKLSSIEESFSSCSDLNHKRFHQSSLAVSVKLFLIYCLLY